MTPAVDHPGVPVRRTQPAEPAEAHTASTMKPGSTAGTSLRLAQG